MFQTRCRSFQLLASSFMLLLASCASLGPGKMTDGVWTVSWYGDEFHGKQTSSGEMYDMHDHTAAHRALPFGTRLELFYPPSRKEIVVRVNDRGPFIHGRDLDISCRAAHELGITEVGVAQIRVRVLGSPGKRPAAQVAEEAGAGSNAGSFETSASDAGWIIQVGSFSGHARATQYAQSIPGECGPVFVSDGSPYRVYVGPFKGHDSALSSESKLKARGFPTLIKAAH